MELLGHSLDGFPHHYFLSQKQKKTHPGNLSVQQTFFLKGVIKKKIKKKKKKKTTLRKNLGSLHWCLNGHE